MAAGKLCRSSFRYPANHDVTAAAPALLDPRRVIEYHAHVYFDAGTRALAARLRTRLADWFGDQLRLGRWKDGPVGPHPKPMYQVAFAPELFGEVVPFLMLNREQLDILVHPESGLGHAGDHAVRPLWLGRPLPLDITYLEAYDAEIAAKSREEEGHS